VLTYDTTEQGNISTLLGDNYTITYTDKFDITPATLTATVTGERDYGTNLPQNSYTTADTATKGTWNVKLEGLAGGDTAATALNDANVKTVLNAIDSGDGTVTTQMGKPYQCRDIRTERYSSYRYKCCTDSSKYPSTECQRQV